MSGGEGELLTILCILRSKFTSNPFPCPPDHILLYCSSSAFWVRYHRPLPFIHVLIRSADEEEHLKFSYYYYFNNSIDMTHPEHLFFVLFSDPKPNNRRQRNSYFRQFPPEGLFEGLPPSPSGVVVA